MVKNQPLTKRPVRRWSEEVRETLQTCFEVTDEQAFCEPHGENIDGLTECITDYRIFCVAPQCQPRLFIATQITSHG